MSHCSMLSKYGNCASRNTSWKSVLFKNKDGKSSRYFVGIFSKRIIPLPFWIWDDYSHLDATRLIKDFTIHSLAFVPSQGLSITLQSNADGKLGTLWCSVVICCNFRLIWSSVYKLWGSTREYSPFVSFSCWSIVVRSLDRVKGIQVRYSFVQHQ